VSPRKMREIDFYESLGQQCAQYMQEQLGESFSVEYIHNQMDGKSELRAMVDELHVRLDLPAKTVYVPKLKIDILIGILDRDKVLRLLVVEVKQGSALGLVDYSQLIGYMGVSKIIPIGLLILVSSSSGEALSADFRNYIDMGALPMDWKAEVTSTEQTIHYRTGILKYTPGGNLTMVKTEKSYGLSSWTQLSNAVIESQGLLDVGPLPRVVNETT
jgi:hypothetical protein